MPSRTRATAWQWRSGRAMLDQLSILLRQDEHADVAVRFAFGQMPATCGSISRRGRTWYRARLERPLSFSPASVLLRQNGAPFSFGKKREERPRGSKKDPCFEKSSALRGLGVQISSSAKLRFASSGFVLRTKSRQRSCRSPRRRFSFSENRRPFVSRQIGRRPVFSTT